MAGIYNADIYCDDCITRIKNDIAYEIWNRSLSAMPDGSSCDGHSTFEELVDYLEDMYENNYDSGEYPKYHPDDSESDGPQHCAGCSIFLENDLTSDGMDYVLECVNEDLEAGITDSVAINEWMPYYNLDYTEQCVACGSYAELNDDEECEECDDSF